MNRSFTFHVQDSYMGPHGFEVVKRMNNDPKGDRQMCICRSQGDAHSIRTALELAAKDPNVEI